MKIKNVVMRLGFRFNVVSECQQSSTKSYLPKKIKSNLGFTLVELLVAIAILQCFQCWGGKFLIISSK
jgi:general secretion pathway protein J